MSAEDLPVILVSAADAAAADAVISELIDNEMVCDGEGGAGGARVWELRNKYYTARVRVVALSDRAHDAQDAHDAHDAHDLHDAHVAAGVEAHVVYLAENECTAAVLERRAGVGQGEGDAGCEVRLVLCECEPDDVPTELRDAARKHQYEVVCMRECAGEGVEGVGEAGGPFPELRGAGRAREALHAHPWAGLRMRRDHVAPPHPPHPPHPASDDEFSPFQTYQSGYGSASGSSSAGSGSEPEPDAAECQRRAARLAAALGACAAGGRGEGEGGSRARRARAEQLLAACCRALGTDLARL